MNICVFNKYKVHLINKYDYITDREFGETSYTTEEEEWTKEMDGGTLIDIVAKMLLDTEVINITSLDKFIHISYFNPMNGTSAEIDIEYEEIKEQENFNLSEE